MFSPPGCSGIVPAGFGGTMRKPGCGFTQGILARDGNPLEHFHREANPSLLSPSQALMRLSLPPTPFAYRLLHSVFAHSRVSEHCTEAVTPGGGSIGLTGSMNHFADRVAGGSAIGPSDNITPTVYNSERRTLSKPTKPTKLANRPCSSGLSSPSVRRICRLCRFCRWHCIRFSQPVNTAGALLPARSLSMGFIRGFGRGFWSARPWLSNVSYCHGIRPTEIPRAGYYALLSERIKANPHSTDAVFDKMKISGLQSAIDGARFDVDQGSSLIRCDPCYFTTALLAPAARWRYAQPYR